MTRYFGIFPNVKSEVDIIDNEIQDNNAMNGVQYQLFPFFVTPSLCESSFQISDLSEVMSYCSNESRAVLWLSHSSHLLSLLASLSSAHAENRPHNDQIWPKFSKFGSSKCETKVRVRVSNWQFSLIALIIPTPDLPFRVVVWK